MESMLKVKNPVAGIDIIEISAPEYDHMGLLFYPVNIDGTDVSFYLNEEAVWEIKEDNLIDKELKWFIGELIERKEL